MDREGVNPTMNNPMDNVISGAVYPTSRYKYFRAIAAVDGAAGAAPVPQEGQEV